MGKEMEKEKNITMMVNYNLKENIYMVIKEKENYILMEIQNMKVNIYTIKNITEKDLAQMVI